MRSCGLPQLMADNQNALMRKNIDPNRQQTGLPHLAMIDYDVVVVGYPVNPNGAKVPKPNRIIKLSCAINLSASSVSRIAVFISFALCFGVDHH